MPASISRARQSSCTAFIRNPKSHVMDRAHTHFPALGIWLMEYVNVPSAARQLESMPVPFHARGRESQDRQKASRRFGIVFAQRNAFQV